MRMPVAVLNLDRLTASAETVPLVVLVALPVATEAVSEVVFAAGRPVDETVTLNGTTAIAADEKLAPNSNAAEMHVKVFIR